MTAPGIGKQKTAPWHAVHACENRRQYAQQRDEPAEENDFAAMPRKKILPDFDTSVRHANVTAISQEKGITVLLS